jgi:hypothetical protein
MHGSFLVILMLLNLIVASCSSSQPTAEPTGLPEASTSTIGYPSVADALAALKSREDVLVEVKDGWTIITEAGALTTWSFTPQGHPAHPAVAKRVLYQENGSWTLKMDVRCEADKEPCDQFVRDFEALNEQMRKFIEQDQLTKQAQ